MVRPELKIVETCKGKPYVKHIVSIEILERRKNINIHCD